MKTSLSQSAIHAAQGPLEEALASLARLYPRESGRRQPVHSVYGGAHLFRAGTARRLGDVALAALEEYAPSAFTFALAVALPGGAGKAAQGKSRGLAGACCVRASAGKTSARAGRGLSYRFRRWLWQPLRCRSG